VPTRTVVRHASPRAIDLRPGEWVQVRSEAEIRATLDGDDSLDGLPFMPEMRRFCGRQYVVKARADRTVVQKLGVRRMRGTVHLDDLRCDGAAHDGCDRGCLIFWKEAWLERVPARPRAIDRAPARPLKTRAGDGWFCQSSELGRATAHQPLFDPLQFLRAPSAEALSPLTLVRSMAILAYDLVKWKLGGREWNELPGPCTRTPTAILGLRPGERVRVRSKPEILATLDRHGWNHGMEFSREMLPYCGRELTVLRRCERVILDESTRMIDLQHTVILDGAVYRALNRRAVPRREYMFWRECWLERVERPASCDRARHAIQRST
jgi:hypothetical protein